MRTLPWILLLSACPRPPILEPDTVETGDTDPGDTDDGWLEVAFRETDLVIPPTGRYDAGAHYVDTDLIWTSVIHRPAPAKVAGKAHLVVYPSDQPFPGSRVRVDRLQRRDDATPWRLYSTILVPEGCDVHPLPLPAASAIEIDALAEAPRVDLEPPVVEKVACSGTVADLDVCSLDKPCASGLVCHGLSTTTVSGGEGTCREKSLSGSFPASGEGAIPDGDLDGALFPIAVAGVGTVTEDVAVFLDFTHSDPAQLVVSLTNPDGTEVWLRDREPGAPEGIRRAYVAVGFPGDEAANGSWSLRVVDTAAGGSGRVNEAILGLTTRMD